MIKYDKNTRVSQQNQNTQVYKRVGIRTKIRRAANIKMWERGGGAFYKPASGKWVWGLGEVLYKPEVGVINWSAIYISFR